MSADPARRDRISTLVVTVLLSVAGTASLVGGWMWSRHEGVGFVGSVASVVGLVLTAYVALRVDRIRRGYVRQVMLKTCLVRLVERRADLKRAIDRENVPLVRQVLSRISAVLDEVGLHDDGSRDIEWQSEELREVARSNPHLVLARALDALPEVDRRIESLGLVLEEMTWGRKHE
jgi:hypothetical protein